MSPHDPIVDKWCREHGTIEDCRVSIVLPPSTQPKLFRANIAIVATKMLRGIPGPRVPSVVLQCLKGQGRWSPAQGLILEGSK